METRLECFYAGTRAEIQAAIDQRLLLKRSHLVPLIVIVGPSSEGKAAVSLCLREEGCWEKKSKVAGCAVKNSCVRLLDFVRRT